MDLLKTQSTAEQFNGRIAFHTAEELPCNKAKPGAIAPLPCEDHYQLFFANNPAPMWLLDESTLGIVKVNLAACELYGYSREEFLCLTLPDLYPADHRAEAQEFFQALQEGHAGAKTEVVWRHQTKAKRPLDVQIAISETLIGTRPTALMVVHDITDLKRIETQLHDSRMELELRVKDRTAEIERSNAILLKEMSDRRQLEQKLLEVSESEQRKLGQDLHDDLGQQLTGMALLASVLANDLQNQSNPLAGEAKDLVKYLGEASLSARNLARGLYPITLDRGGFLVALDELAVRISKMPGVSCEFKCEETFKLKDQVAIQFYRIIQEAVNNAIKHGKAKHILIQCKIVKNEPTVIVINDGEPFREPKSTAKGMGLSLMRHRARMVGAHLVIRKGKEGGCETICTLRNSEPTASCKRRKTEVGGRKSEPL